MADLTDRLPVMSDFAGVVMPESEAGVLACAMFTATARSKVVTELDRDDFNDPWHQQVWMALRAAEDADAPAEPQTCVHYLSAAMREQGGFRRLLELESGAVCETSLPWHIAALRQATARRRAVSLVMSAAGSTGSADPEEMTRRIEKAMEVVDRGLPIRSAGEGLAATAKKVREDIARGNEGGGLLTPWYTLNALTGGMYPGDLTILGARPSVGKSGTGISWAIGAAQQGYWTGFASLEMSEAQCHHRILAQLANIESKDVKMRHLSDVQVAQLDYWAKESDAWPLNIIDKPGMRVRDLYALAKARCPKDASLVLVDYLQLITPDDKRRPKVEQIGEITKGLKNIARALRIHVVCLSQLHRLDPKKGGNPEPTMADLRDSGNIEEDADNILLLHRQDYGNANATGPSKMKMIVAKQRNGPTGIVNLTYDRATQRVWEGV